MSDQSSADVFHRLQISPSKNNTMRKPALRLSPRRVHKNTPYLYTPSKYESFQNTEKYTQSLDRSSKLVVPSLSPTNSIQSKSFERILRDETRSPIIYTHSTESKKSTKLNANNLLNKLRQETASTRYVEEITNQNTKKNSRTEKGAHNLLSSEKSVKFYLPNEISINESINEITKLLTKVIERQNRIESSINDIKLALNIKK